MMLMLGAFFLASCEPLGTAACDSSPQDADTGGLSQANLAALGSPTSEHVREVGSAIQVLLSL